jgi:hypothetical protein
MTEFCSFRVKEQSISKKRLPITTNSNFDRSSPPQLLDFFDVFTMLVSVYNRLTELRTQAVSQISSPSISGLGTRIFLSISICCFFFNSVPLAFLLLRILFGICNRTKLNLIDLARNSIHQILLNVFICFVNIVLSLIHYPNPHVLSFDLS